MSFLKSLKSSTLGWLSLVSAAVILLSVNFISDTALRHLKADLTEARLFTISKGTEKTLTALDEPIRVDVYYSQKLGEAAPNYAKYFGRVRALLEQYRDISKGKFDVRFINPEPFSDAEDRAVGAGLQGVRLNQEGDLGFFGLVATNSTDNEKSIRIFTPDRERFLEYDITKLVHGLANPKKPVIGLISGIPVDGGFSPRGGQTRPWAVMAQIREIYDVKTLGADITAIPNDIDVLMLVQPQGLTDKAVYAIDQFALGGGKILAFVDPVAETARAAGPSGLAASLPPAALDKLFASWGVKFDAANIAADSSNARRVQYSDGTRPIVTDYVAWLDLKRTALNQGDVLSDGIETLGMGSPGYFTKAENAATKFVSVLETSAQASKVAAVKLQLRPDPLALLKEYRPGGKRLSLAARVTGEAKTAFSDGPPKEKDKNAGTEGESAESKANNPTPHKKQGQINVILVADTDMLHDRFWVEIRNLFGQQVSIPHAHNAVFVMNALGNLSGGDALIGLRGRGIDNRPFTMVEDIRRASEQQFRQKEQALLGKLKDVQAQLAKVEQKGDANKIILTEKDRRTIAGFRAQMIETRQELRAVKRALRKDIDQLDGFVKFINIAGIPLMIGFGGIAAAIVRRRRSKA